MSPPKPGAAVLARGPPSVLHLCSSYVPVAGRIVTSPVHTWSMDGAPRPRNPESARVQDHQSKEVLGQALTTGKGRTAPPSGVGLRKGLVGGAGGAARHPMGS